MPTFFFDVFDGREVARDDVGADLDSAEDAYLEAASMLPDFARDIVLDQQGHDFAASVRDSSGQVLYRAILLFRAQSTQSAAQEGVVSIAGGQYQVARAITLRKQAKALGEKLSDNIQSLFSTIEDVRLNVEAIRRTKQE